MGSFLVYFLSSKLSGLLLRQPFFKYLMIDIEQLRGQIQDVVALYRITAQVNCAKDTLLIVLNREPEQEVDYSQVVAALKDYLSEIKLQDEEIPERPVYGDRLLPPNCLPLL
jgi:hypothetical protein